MLEQKTERKEILYHFTSNCLLQPSTCIIVVSKIAPNFSELKTEKRAGAPFQADLHY